MKIPVGALIAAVAPLLVSAKDYLGEIEPLTNLAVVNPVVDCGSLVSLDLTDVAGAGSAITSASYVNQTGITYCSVTGTLVSNVSFSTLLPATTWTQRYLQAGCGGYCGYIDLSVYVSDGSPELANGEFVLSTNDMAGSQSDTTFGLDRSRRVDFAYLANHLNAVTSKKIAKAYYGQVPVYSYFNGCSDGGREALMEAIRYPDDFNGIIAGAPVMLWLIHNTIYHVWDALANIDANGKNILLSSKKELLHAAVMKECDELDGLVDGLLQEPRLCRFDPVSIQCAADTADTSTCLTAAEVQATRKMYAGSIDPATGLHLTLGASLYGAELGWMLPNAANDTDNHFADMALETLKYFAYEGGLPDNYTLQDVEFTIATLEKLKARHALFDATNPDLSAFKAAGGKLIMWHGLSDPGMATRVTIAFHELIHQFFGYNEAESFERLYLLPGVYHCGSGYGMSGVNFVTPLLEWVELGNAPNGVMTKTKQDPHPPAPAPSTRLLEEQLVNRTRPVYPYPYLPEYTGYGDANDGANFVQGMPLYTKRSPHWAGEDYFTPYTPVEG